MPRGTDKEIDRLYELPLEEFTQARNELARSVRADDREGADRISKLRKPSAPAWALNRLARSHRKDVRALLRAGDSLRKAQESGRADRMRKAAEGERAAVERLAGAAGELLPGKAAALERVRNTLHAAATDEELRAELEQGRVTTDREAVGFGVATRAQPGKAGRTPDLRKRLRGARAEQERAERAVEVARDEAEDARRRLGAAERELREAEKAADKASSAVRKLEEKAY